jgi:hypothetical protein
VAGKWEELRWTHAGGEAKAANRSSTLISPKTDLPMIWTHRYLEVEIASEHEMMP